jgi:sulfate transport system ATP-binding protein
MSIQALNITKTWGSFCAVNDVSISVGDGEFVALLGPSGSGKTTLLRIIAGLEKPDRGRIFLHEKDSTDHHVRYRKVGFVFQHYAIFRNMNVYENVAFGLRVRPKRARPTEEVIRQRVKELLELVHLEVFAERMPDQLSGGQRQRVALARALAVEPKVLLLDEPFGALDARVRQELRRWLRNLQKKLGLTTIIVTHDQEEAMEVADRIVIMNHGIIEQTGTPAELWDHPRSAFVFEFLGHSNAYDCRVTGGRAQIPGMNVAADGYSDGAALRVGIRSFDVKLWADESSECVLQRISQMGDLVRLQVGLPDAAGLTIQMPSRSSMLNGIYEGCRVHLEPTRSYLFPVVSDQVIK